MRRKVKVAANGSLVPVEERMVLRKTFPECGGFVDQIRIIAGLGPEER
jgi:hypothetical protein